MEDFDMQSLTAMLLVVLVHRAGGVVTISDQDIDDLDGMAGFIQVRRNDAGDLQLSILPDAPSSGTLQ